MMHRSRKAIIFSQTQSSMQHQFKLASRPTIDEAIQDETARPPMLDEAIQDEATRPPKLKEVVQDKAVRHDPELF